MTNHDIDLWNTMSHKLPEDASICQLYQADRPDGIIVFQGALTWKKALKGAEIYVNSTKYQLDDGLHSVDETELELKYCAVRKYRYLPVFGNELPFVRPPSGYPDEILVQHWAGIFRNDREMMFTWGDIGDDKLYITPYAYEQFPRHTCAVDPDVLYEVAAKSFIPRIPCGQARVINEPQYPCVLKLDRNSGGKGVFVIKEQEQYQSLMTNIRTKMPSAKVLLTEYIQNQVNNFCVYIFIHKEGGFRYLGTSVQNINESCHYTGCVYELDPQQDLEQQLKPTVEPVAHRLHDKGFFGVANLDILVDVAGQQYLIDINPRWGTSAPALLGLRKLGSRGQRAALLRLAQRLPGPLDQLLSKLKEIEGGQILLASACGETTVLCDVVVYSATLDKCVEIFAKLQQL